MRPRRGSSATGCAPSEVCGELEIIRTAFATPAHASAARSANGHQARRRRTCDAIAAGGAGAATSTGIGGRRLMRTAGAMVRPVARGARTREVGRLPRRTSGAATAGSAGRRRTGRPGATTTVVAGGSTRTTNASSIAATVGSGSAGVAVSGAASETGDLPESAASVGAVGSKPGSGLSTVA